MLAMRSLNDDNDIALILPSDHAIEKNKAFKDAVHSAISSAKYSLVTF